MIVPPDSAFQAQTPLEKFFASQVTARRLLPLHELALDHHLGGDAGMIGAGLPQHITPAHTLETTQDILQGVVERMAHVQRAGYVRRWDDDRKRFGVAASRPAGAKRLCPLPRGVDAALDLAGLVGFFDHVGA